MHDAPLSEQPSSAVSAVSASVAGPEERRLARTAGLLYLVIIVGAGFAEGVVRGGLVTPGDAHATAQAIAGSPGLYRLGLVGDLIAFLADAGVAVLLYLLLRPVSRAVSLLAAGFRLVAHPAIGSVNLLNHWAAGLIAAGPGYLSTFSAEQREGLVMLALELHGYGYLLAGAFFGVHLALLAWLLLRSARCPRWLCVALGVAGAAYLAEALTHFGAPGWAEVASGAVVVAASVAEAWLCGWLLLRGWRGR